MEDKAAPGTAVSNSVENREIDADETRQLLLDNGISYIEYVRGAAIADRLAVTFVSYGANDRHAPGFAESAMRQLGYDVLVVKASRNNWFQDLSIDTLANIRSSLPEYHDVVTYGSDMGAYAAMYFADTIGASKSIALSPQLSIDPAIAPFEHRWQQDAARIDFTHKPMVEVLRDTAACHHVIYDPTITDGKHVDIMCGATDRIRPVRVPYSGHPSGFFLAETGILMPSLRGILDDHPVPIRTLVRAGRRRSPSYFAGLAVRARDLRHFNLATYAFEQALALSNRVDVMMTYSQFLRSRGDPAQALEIFRKAETYYTPHVHDLAFKAHLLELTGQDDEALSTLETVLKAEPDYPAFYMAERNLLRRRLVYLERTAEMLDAALRKTRAQRELEEGSQRPDLTAATIFKYLLVSIAMVVLVMIIARYGGFI